MRHDTCRKNLSAYLDNELHEDERHALEAHLEACPECRAELAELKSLSGLVKKHVMEPVPPALRRAVLEPRASRRWLKPVLALSAAAAGLVVVFNLTQPDGTTYMSSAFSSRDGSALYAPSMEGLSSRQEPAPETPAAKPSSPELAGGAGAAQPAAAPEEATESEEAAREAAPAEAKEETADMRAEPPAAAALNKAAAVRGSLARAKASGMADAMPAMAAAEKKAAGPCFCISPSLDEASPYSIMRLPEARCEGEVFKPRPGSSASAFLPPCPAGLPEENAADLQESCFCIAHNPDSVPAYTVGRIASPDCAPVRFRPRPGIPAGKYLPACPKP